MIKTGERFFVARNSKKYLAKMDKMDNRNTLCSYPLLCTILYVQHILYMYSQYVCILYVYTCNTYIYYTYITCIDIMTAFYSSIPSIPAVAWLAPLSWSNSFLSFAPNVGHGPWSISKVILETLAVQVAMFATFCFAVQKNNSTTQQTFWKKQIYISNMLLYAMLYDAICI